MPLTADLKKRLDDMVQDKKVLLFMKGSKHFPQCGFSAQVIQILNELVPTYDTVNVLSDPALRDGIKEYSSWPTIPQLYVGGQFVGGCDIVKDMYASGELKKLLGSAGVAPKAVAKPEGPVAAPVIKVTDGAKSAFLQAAVEAGDDKLRMEINAEFQVELFFAPPNAADISVTANGVEIRLDAESAKRANGVSIDFVDRPGGGGFKIENPNEPPRVKPLAARDLKAMIDAGEAFELFDVRPEAERNLARIGRARPLDDEGKRRLAGLDKGSKIVFHCHHGMRSRAAAEEAIGAGYRNVFNLEGGIEAWSAVDPSVPRY
ncbi:MAG TPA: Grx4 family monothiol glutaredoxin [Opitutaceae bacterium]